MRDEHRRLLVSVISLAVLTLSLATPLFAGQAPTGTISGTVTDTGGAVITGAKVTITEKSTGRPITVTSNEIGFFEARALPSGEYSIKIEHTGFVAEVLES